MLLYFLTGVIEVRIVDDGGESFWTIAAAVGTVSAVIVALIGPLAVALVRRLKKPKLRLRVEGATRNDGSVAEYWLSPDQLLQNTLWITIGNVAGRRRAENVELFASIRGYSWSAEGASGSDWDGWVSTQATVAFPDGSATSSVPANFWRRARLGVVRWPTPSEPEKAGEWLVASDRPLPIRSGARYEIVLTVTADGLDALFYFTELTLEQVEDNAMSLRWTVPATSLKPNDPRLPSIV